MDITTIGFDLAKRVFQVHGADGEGRVVLRRKVRRGKVLAFFAGLPSCLVGMEACASAHYWALELQALGHKVRLIPPQYVRPFVKTNKNDATDAEAICEAVTRPTMRFAPAKSAEQQSVRADNSRPGSVWCPDNTRVAARTGWGGYRSAGMAT